MSRKIKFAIVGAVSVLALLVVRYLVYEAPESGQESALSAVADEEVAAQDVDPVEVDRLKDHSDIEEPTDSVLASRLVYLSHSSLRSDEVFDPDSQVNIELMQKMVSKVIARDSKQ